MPDAVSSYHDSKYVVFGVPFDGTSSYRRGSRLAPNSIRKAYDNLESFDPFYNVNFPDLKICDLGDAIVGEDVVENVYTVETIVSIIKKDGKIPIMLGGEHSITVGAIRNFSECTMIIIDAHSDFRDGYMGNPLNHACVTRRSLEVLGKNRIISIGTRSVSKEEYESERFNDVEFVFSSEVRKRGIDKIIDDMNDFASKKIYFSIDMDGIDPAFAPGVGTPEPYGLMDTDVKRLINRFARNSIGFDIVEMTPLYDNGNTSMLAAKLIQDFIGSRETAANIL